MEQEPVVIVSGNENLSIMRLFMTALGMMKARVRTLIEQWIFMLAGVIPQEYIFGAGSTAANLHLLILYKQCVLYNLISVF